MKKNVVVIGAGMGGLTAALRLAREGFRVQLLEGRAEAGGLASGNVYEGFSFDAGPYILLDRPGLEWAFASVGMKFSEHTELRAIEHVYSVASPGRPTVNIYSSDAATAREMEEAWPGSGELYLRFVRKTGAIESSLRPLLYGSAPGPMSMLGGGRLRHAGFLLRSLQSVLRASRLPQPVVDALSIWTHVAGQRPEEAPSPLAFVPALVHSVGCFYPKDGIRSIPSVLAEAAEAAGVEFRYRTKVKKICTDGSAVTGVESNDDEKFPAGAVVSDCGIGTYLELLERRGSPSQQRCEKLPLQSPGVCAYLAVKGKMAPPYLRFLLPEGDERCRLLIRPGVMNPEEKQGEWYPARLLGPMDHAKAQRMGPVGQAEYLEKLLQEKWWQEGIAEYRVLGRRTPSEWGAEYSLSRNNMNPVMTAKFMREGRLAHRSPDVRGLYWAGSATHPGQWVSFCAISGVLAADCLQKGFCLMLATTIETHSGHKLRVARLGSGPPVILLHGYPDNLQVWSDLAPRLAAQHEVIAFDWPGMGYSEVWSGGATPFDFARRLHTLMVGWKIEKATIIGHDMGGQPALAFAAEHPERISQLVVMNSLVIWDEKTSWEIALLRKFGWNRILLERLPRAVFFRAIRTFLPRGYKLSAGLRSDLWESFQRPEVRKFVVRMCAGYQGTLPRLKRLYPAIRTPSLFLWAERDKHFPAAHGRKLSEFVPGSLFEEIPRAGHWMALNLAEEVSAHILRFLGAKLCDSP